MPTQKKNNIRPNRKMSKQMSKKLGRYRVFLYSSGITSSIISCTQCDVDIRAEYKDIPRAKELAKRHCSETGHVIHLEYTTVYIYRAKKPKE